MTSLAPFALWIAGWALIIAVLFIFSASNAGKRIVYYTLWLAIVFLIVTHYADIGNIFQAANITQGQI